MKPQIENSLGDKKYENNLSEIDPKAGDMQEANKKLHEAAIESACKGFALNLERQVIENSLGDLKDKVVNASDLAFPSISKTNIEKYSFPIPNSSSLFDAKETKGNHVGYDGIPSSKQIVALIDYCNENNLIPEDLIAFHREHSKSTLKRKLKPVDGKETILKEGKHLNWREKNQKRKTGQND